MTEKNIRQLSIMASHFSGAVQELCAADRTLADAFARSAASVQHGILTVLTDNPADEQAHRILQEADLNALCLQGTEASAALPRLLAEVGFDSGDAAELNKWGYTTLHTYCACLL